MTEKKLKPFDLERALAGDPVVTRDGKKAKIVFLDRETGLDKCGNELKTILSVYQGGDFGWQSQWIHEDGKVYDTCESNKDLFMIQKTKKLWIAIEKNYPEIGKRKVSHDCKNKDDLIYFGWNELEYHYVEIEIEE